MDVVLGPRETLPKNPLDVLHSGAVAKGSCAEDGGLDRTVPERNPRVERELALNRR